ncbi:hypothetical protein BD324DRAFT_628625 [Kockovaella imperatae]|uniref:Uncharacterized protein n=1 Tax=Kockovaella imperatae TaxID=4999 RepID=A0A1Y1UE97_9TREE|nr:hypothetical protein BD324DRAFT_628625 [Kockovaella imperatae]ORX36381.1 hypothetical protein BD324DRAFT_628625 [Kockovaella imperatae]
MTVTAPTTFTPSSPPDMASRHMDETPPPLVTPPAAAAAASNASKANTTVKRTMSSQSDGDRLTDENLQRQNKQISDANAEVDRETNAMPSIEQKKRTYSQDLYEYTKSLVDGVTKTGHSNGTSSTPSESNDDAHSLSLSTLSMKDQDDAAPAQASEEMAAVPAIH